MSDVGTVTLEEDRGETAGQPGTAPAAVANHAGIAGDEGVDSGEEDLSYSGPRRQLSRGVARVVSARVPLRRRVIELFESRELFVFLVRKELKIKYKNSVLGFLWSMLNPALVLAIYYVVFTYFIPNSIPKFALFLFSGLLAWNLFNGATMGAASTIVNNSGIVKKVAFPREILALSQVGTSTVFFGFQSCVFALFLIGFGVHPDWSYLPVLLLAFVALIVFTAALAVFLSAVNVYLRDTQHLIEVLLQAWFWGAPIVYAFSDVSTKLERHKPILYFYMADPLTPIVLAFQRCLYGAVPGAVAPAKATGAVIAKGATSGISIPLLGGGVLPHYSYLWYVVVLSIVLVVSLGLLLGALVVFGRVEGNFAEQL